MIKKVGRISFSKVAYNVYAMSSGGLEHKLSITNTT
jgi:hypothetical protein